MFIGLLPVEDDVLHDVFVVLVRAVVTVGHAICRDIITFAALIGHINARPRPSPWRTRAGRDFPTVNLA